MLADPDRPPAILDAAAMAALNGSAARQPGGLILTPHAGETAHLLDADEDTIAADPVRAAREAAGRFSAVVALKGAETHVAAPDGAAYVFRGGTIGLGTAGSGDVLAGIIAGLTARGAAPVQAVVLGVHLHGAAGTRLARAQGPLGFLAREILVELPRLLTEL
jgi:ADP-dependent NAD(P)H-hydrate dehydratase